jgi:hypothetical protein
MIREILAIGAVSLVASCALIIKTNVDDLKLTDLGLVKADDAPHDQKLWGPQGERKLLVASLTTTYDLESIETERGYLNLHADVSYCGQPDKSEWAFFFFHGMSLNPLMGAEEASRYRAEFSSEPKGAPHTYQIWFDYRTKGRKKFGVDVDYDLTTESSDLCVRISATPYMAIGVGLTSNTVVIPKQMLEKLLDAELRLR